MRTSSETLKEVEDELKLACPEPMNRMLDWQTRKDALAKKESRDKATSINVPATGVLARKKIQNIIYLPFVKYLI